MPNRSVLFIVLGLVVTLPVRADELAAEATKLCEKVKSCAMAQIAEEDVTPEMRQMMQPMLDGMCDDMRSSMDEIPTGDQLYKPALACMRSMQTLSCAAMQDEESMKTPACETYEKLRKQMPPTSE